MPYCFARPSGRYAPSPLGASPATRASISRTIAESQLLLISADFATGGVGECLIVSMNSSMFASATARPSSTWPGARALVDLLEVHACAHHDAPAASAITLAHARKAVDDAGCREVRRRDDLHQLIDGRVRVLQQVMAGVDDLVEVVRRNVGRHADRDAARAVDQQVRQARRQDQRFFL